LSATGGQQGFIDFRVDTGADESILHPVDALRLGFKIADLVRAQPTWGAPKELIGIGGRVPPHDELVGAYDIAL